MLIDKRSPEFADIPDSLDGEVLLERVFDQDGSLIGYATATRDAVLSMKARTDAELLAAGWFKYRDTARTF